MNELMLCISDTLRYKATLDFSSGDYQPIALSYYMKSIDYLSNNFSEREINEALKNCAFAWAVEPNNRHYHWAREWVASYTS